MVVRLIQSADYLEFHNNIQKVKVRQVQELDCQVVLKYQKFVFVQIGHFAYPVRILTLRPEEEVQMSQTRSLL